MKERRFRFGILVTVMWLAFTGVIYYASDRPTELNAWGDFFAGFFAPLAFLWLVLGYMQQGEELKQSTQALRLQAEELKNSVEQQSNLVDVSRQQLEQETETARFERARHEQEMYRLRDEHERARRARLPKFVLSEHGSTKSGPVCRYGIKVVNAGGMATNVLFEAATLIGRPQHRASSFPRGSEAILEIVWALPVEKPDEDGIRKGSFVATANDEDGATCTFKWHVIEQNGRLDFLPDPIV